MRKNRGVSCTAVISVSFNTRKLTALLLWSLHRVLESSDLSIVIVDNGSTDGTVDLLRQAQDAGLCSLLLSPINLGHGPALNLALEQTSLPPSYRDRPH